MEFLFWLSVFIIFYTYIGYGILLYGFVALKRLVKKRPKICRQADDHKLPTCTVIVAAYNEASIIREKIQNTLVLAYPQTKIRYLFVTDGSTDGTPEIVGEFPDIRLLHQQDRSGKIAAVHRAMQEVSTEVVVFTDANTFLNPEALVEICKHYADENIGVVAGEKRVYAGSKADASSAGEGFYWKYESTLKKWDSELHTVVGTAGELFSIRTNLYEPVPTDTVLDDFMISVQIAAKGFKVIYEPSAYATELASENVEEELKRKIRIAAGGIQSIIRLKKLLNPFHTPWLSFQYISHRVLRWTLAPVLLPAVFFINGVLLFRDHAGIYTFLFGAQVVFYGLSYIGWLLERRRLKVKVAFIPFYFCLMNYAVLMGMVRYLKGRQSVVWERSTRKMTIETD